MMRRLYVQIYLSFVAAILLFALFASIHWYLTPRRQADRVVEGMAEIAGDVLPPPDRPIAELQAALERLTSRLTTEFTIRSADGELLAATGRPLPAPSSTRSRSGIIHVHGEGVVTVMHLPDGRWLLSRSPRLSDRHIQILLGLAVALAIAAYPVARGIARRLERLRARVEDLGTGDLSARVKPEGSDEIAALAESFNRAADRIEQLVKAQRSVLANASHEIRSPLARLRMAVELLTGDDRPDLRARITKEITELDALVGEILLASKLEAVGELERTEEVDLLALLAEEAAETDATVGGEPVRITGDALLLRRLIRNLLDNARRHASGSAIDASVMPSGTGGAILAVCDRGPGVPGEDREKIFDPFYRSARTNGAAEGGIGLGLSLVRQIARHHGGDARCLPRDGGGTRFEVTLCSSPPGDPPRC